ncbi:hypothetical protein P280DRAFT_480097 [Massarina eburnea CBS 473.64]|uniref:Uncharacterized protein n=1 Tax=Massarina eburnea CBS 473.64 TaxID=1395130 RepID=A0A6A6S2G4_9PLEO|nr:hypothetical protein P280DRAFT_480097 [Massarina eburnea CBS 473.64]
MTSLPADEWARLNREITGFFQRPADPNDTKPLSFKGIGSFTYFKQPDSTHEHSPNRFSSRRKATTTFLPLGGPDRIGKEHRRQGDLPDEINRVYDELREVVLHEEQFLGTSKENKPIIEDTPISHTRSKSAAGPPPPPPPRTGDNGYLDDIRDSALHAIRPDLLRPRERAKLKQALDDSGWPTRFTTISAYTAPPQNLKGTIAPWSYSDTTALQCILDNSDLPIDAIATHFFPDRSVNSVTKKRGKMRTLKGWYSHKKGSSGRDVEDGDVRGLERVESRRSVVGEGRGGVEGARGGGGGGGRRASSGGYAGSGSGRISVRTDGEDVDMAGMGTEDMAKSAGVVHTSTAYFHASQDPRQRRWDH